MSALLTNTIQGLWMNHRETFEVISFENLVIVGIHHSSDG